MTDRPMEEIPDPFEPLSQAESADAAAATGVSGAEEEVWMPTMPAPNEPPPASEINHHSYGTTVRHWVYRDERGAPLFAMVRFESVDFDGNVQKEILPYTFGFRAWQVRSGPNAGMPKRHDGWHFKLPRQPVPLYGIDRLADQPSAVVLLCEGEKAADAATGLFPGHVCITSQGGCGAPHKSDWSPLAGRHVAIWPDNDAAGGRYADAVASLAEKAGARSVLVVNVKQNWPEGWDVGDPVPDGLDSAVLEEMLATATLGFVRKDDSAYSEIATTEIRRLSALDQLAYQQRRKAAAKTLSMGVTELDRLCTQRRKEAAARDANDQAEPEHGQDTPRDTGGMNGLLIDKGNLPDTAAKLAVELATSPFLFDRGGPCRLVRDSSDGRLSPMPLTTDGVVSECHDVCRPFWLRRRPDGTTERMSVTLPKQVADLYLVRPDRWNLRPLDGIAYSPLLHADGSIRVTEGYDSKTRLWCQQVPVVEVPAAPTEHEAHAALRRVRIVFRTFAFADAERVTVPDTLVPVVDVDRPAGADESAFLNALLIAVCRASLPLAPAVMIRAPEISGAGTGKGLLARAMCLVAFGIQPRAMTAGTQLEEMDKRIAAALIGAESALLLDNVNGVALKSDILASAITERPAIIRPLGSSTIKRLNSSALIVVTGNGLTLSEDMVRRFVVMDLDAGVEDPESREFSGDFLGDVQAKRASLLCDLLIIWRWGRQQGAALPAGRPVGSFPEWARWCRDPLVALGCADPAARVHSLKAADPQRAFLAELFNTWAKHHRDNLLSVAELDQSVKAILDPASKGRQYQAAQVRRLDGTRAAGYLLTLRPAAGRWSADLYRLTSTGSTIGEIAMSSAETSETSVARRLPQTPSDPTVAAQWSTVDLEDM